MRAKPINGFDSSLSIDSTRGVPLLISSMPSNIVTQINGGTAAMIIEYKGKKPKISPSAFIAPTAVIIGDVTVGDEASIWWGAVLRSDQNQNPIVVGARTSIQDNCVLHSGEAPTIIEDDCTIGHGAIMEGPLIKRGAIIGMNVTLLENVEIGEEALIAAGSVVVPHTKIPPRSARRRRAGESQKGNRRRSPALDQDGFVDLRESLQKLHGRRLQSHRMSPWQKSETGEATYANHSHRTSGIRGKDSGETRRQRRRGRRGLLSSRCARRQTRSGQAEGASARHSRCVNTNHSKLRKFGKNLSHSTPTWRFSLS